MSTCFESELCPTQTFWNKGLTSFPIQCSIFIFLNFFTGSQHMVHGSWNLVSFRNIFTGMEVGVTNQNVKVMWYQKDKVYKIALKKKGRKKRSSPPPLSFWTRVKHCGLFAREKNIEIVVLRILLLLARFVEIGTDQHIELYLKSIY